MAVVVGMVAIICLVAATAIAWVAWQQSQMQATEMQRIREATDMNTARVLRLESREAKR